MYRLTIFCFFVANLIGCAHVPCKPSQLQKLEGNIYYEEMCTNNNETAHVVTVDPDSVTLKLVKAQGEPSLQKVSTLAQSHNALLAINGGFFHADGKPAGALKIDGKWIAKPANNRGFVGWGFPNNANFVFDRAKKNMGLIESVFNSKPWWEDAQNVVGGIPLLLLNGEKVSVKEEKTLEDFLTNKYARTAICSTKNNLIKLVVIDGGDRKSYGLGLKSGMSIDELSDFLLNIGCENALNLDGGYSSTMVKKGVVINSYALNFLPERSVSDAILVIPKK